MHSLLKQYHPYIVDRHAKTLLPQVSLFQTKFNLSDKGQVSSEPLFLAENCQCFDFLPRQYLAMFRLTVDNIETYLVVIRNVFSAHLKV